MSRKKNITFDDIAKYTNFSKTTISRYFNNPDSLTLKNQEIIAQALVDLNYKESFKILKKEDYINKIFNQFDFKFDETKEKAKELKKLTSDYIEEKIHNE